MRRRESGAICANKSPHDVWDMALVLREVQSRWDRRGTSCRPARRALPQLRQHLLELRNLGHNGVDSWISRVRCVARLRRLALRLVMPSATFDEHSAHSHRLASSDVLHRVLNHDRFSRCAANCLQHLGKRFGLGFAPATSEASSTYGWASR